MPKNKPIKNNRARGAAATSKDLVAAVKKSSLYKALREEGIKKKKANRIVRAVTSPVRVAVGVVEALPSAPTTTSSPPPAPTPRPAPATNAVKKAVKKSAAKKPAAKKPAVKKAAVKKAAVKKSTRKAAKKAATTATPRSSAPSSLENLTKADLVARARTANIAGRSGMSKDELVAALRRS